MATYRHKDSGITCEIPVAQAGVLGDKWEREDAPRAKTSAVKTDKPSGDDK